MTDSILTFDSIWGRPARTITAQTDLERVLVDGARLPMPYWQKHFFFMGAKNSVLETLTRGRFPSKADPGGSHPVFALKSVSGTQGFVVCPCSSSGRGATKWINRGIRLRYTAYCFEKTSYIVDAIRFNLPPSQALQLRFKGQVADRDIHSICERG